MNKSNFDKMIQDMKHLGGSSPVPSLKGMIETMEDISNHWREYQDIEKDTAVSSATATINYVKSQN